MKRLKSSDDVKSYGGEKVGFKDWGRKEDDSSSHKGFHYKSESGKKGLSSSSARSYREEDDRRLIRKRSDYDVDGYERRKSCDRYRDGSERGVVSLSPRGGYSSDRIHRSESFSGSKRDFPKGFRSERDRLRREGSVSSWRWLGGGKDLEEGTKSGGDSARGSKAASEETSNVRSPQGMRDAKSPAWSKDSGSEQSKSVEVKKSESLCAESGNNSEREEGELEPDLDHNSRTEPSPVVENTAGEPPSVPSSSSQEVQNENRVDDNRLEDSTTVKSKEEIKCDRTCIPAKNADAKESEPFQNAMDIGNQSSSSEASSTRKTVENGVEVSLLLDSEKDAHKEEARDVLGSLKSNETKPKQDNDTIVEVKAENLNMSMHAQITITAERHDSHDASRVVNHSLVTKELTHNFKDKGKSVIVSVSGHNDELRDLMSNRDIDIEGPSIRGFDLFFMEPVKKSENSEQKGANKPKDEKQSLEPLELSLRLPNVLLPIGCSDPVQGPDSPSQEISIQSHASSFQTSSDGFTRSFSGSQHFSHNPSCSLTESSFDFEKSVGSRPLFQGVNWQVQSSEEAKNTEPRIHQRSTLNGNVGVSNVQSLPLHNARVPEGSYKTPLELERQLSNNNNNKNPTESQSVGSHETGSAYHKDSRRVMRDVIGTKPADLVEPILAMMVSDPLHIVAQILNEMTPPALANLKESARDIILNPSKRRHLSAFRKSFEKRSDITLQMLSKTHIVQMEILVALKTGIQDFLQTKSDITSSDLAEIFLNLRCRNLTCRSYLPVDECDCKICVQKKGFCSACMCLVCSKFDMASNTCSWVGCDVCLHWCHVDCGLRESFIRNGGSATGSLGPTEMQFHCVACDHPSEMFGFVREVFQNFANGWTAETMSNEIEYVRRIFSVSEDIRGKRLHEISLQLLYRLSNRSDLHQVRSYIMSFFNDDAAFKSDNIQISQQKQLVKQNQGERSSNDISKTSQEAATWMKSIYADRPVQLKTESSDIPQSTPIPKEPVFDELDGMIRIKLAEAQMFQTRADDARREAEGLNRIAQAKSKKIDEEFRILVTKLNLIEAEDIRRQKLKELQVLENAHQEYFNMKVRMEREIKDLLLKMEVTKHNFSF